MLLRILILLLCCGVSIAAQHPQFLGGSISCEVVKVGSNKHRIDVTLKSCWVLGTGPCGPNCTRNDVGKSTMASRKQIEQRMFNDAYFGQFYIDYTENSGNGTIVGLNYVNRTYNVTEYVLNLNERANWETEITKRSYDLPSDLKNAGSINFDGSFVRHLTLQGGDNIRWHIQTQFYINLRNDTGKPNLSPELNTRPYYRAKLNDYTLIKLNPYDPENDIVMCSAPPYVKSYIKNLPGVSIFENCSVGINASAALHYTDDIWISVSMAMKDYNAHTILFGDDKYPPKSFALSSVIFQFMVNVLDVVEMPSFVSPTYENGHKFVIYTGATWNVDIFVCAPKNRTIHTITTDFENATVTDMQQSSTNSLITSATLSWTPVEPNTIRQICVTAEDNIGDQSMERCFLIVVKENNFTRSPTTSATNKPYFISIPQQLVDCTKHVTCILPLYVKSGAVVDTVRVTVDYTGNAKTGAVESTTLNSQLVYRAYLSFSDTTRGHKQICFVAIDVNLVESGETCVMISFLSEDPCISSPCLHNGICRGNDETGTLTCECIDSAFVKYSGHLCEIRTGICDITDCEHGVCVSKLFDRDGIKSHCYCEPGYTGYNCDEVKYACPSDACSYHGICISEPTGSHSCLCYKRYNGKNCETDQCPSSTSASDCVPDECKNDPCNGNGVCSSGPMCRCAPVYEGTDCSIVKTDMYPAVTGLDFVQPTPNNGAQLTCYSNNGTLLPCTVLVAFVSRGIPVLRVIVSPELTFKKRAVDVNTNDPKIVYSEITIEGTADKNEFICLKLVGSLTTSERCYGLHVKTDPMDNALSLQFHQKDATIKFESPSPNEGSKFVCNEDEECMLVFFTTKLVTGCNNVVSPHENVTVFPAKYNAYYNSCETEVTYKYDTAGNKTICFNSASTGFQQRCFTVHVYPGNRDPCLSSPCQNGGRCLRNDVNTFICKCGTDYSGKYCENGPCVADTVCGNESFCNLYNGHKTCHCRIGFFGTQCVNETTSDISIFNLFFTDTAKPSILRCVVDQPCSVAFVLSGNPFERLLVEPIPRILLGRVDAEVDVVTTKVEPLPQTHMYSLDVTLEGKHIGLYDTCIQAQYHYYKIRYKVDEVCFKVNVTQDVSTLYGHMDRPHFIASSLPTQSEVICTEDTICHVLYNVTAGDGNSGKCVTAYPTSYSDALKFHIFSTCDSCSSTSGSSTEYCQIDVSFESSDAGNKQHLCVGLRINNSDLVGEERCFNVYIPSTEEAYNSSASSCYNLQCQNGGFCDGTVPRCYCKMGFTKGNCYQAYQDSYTNTAKTFLPRDIGFPRIITCGIDTVCTVPFVVSSNNDAQSNCSIGFSSPQLQASIAECNIYDASPRLILQVHPNAVGNYSTCVQLIKQDITSDEVCVNVDVIDSSGNGIDKTKPYFVSPTLPDHTTVLCKKDTYDVCYVLLYFNAGASHTGQCPTIRQVEVPSVKTLHIFEPELYGNHCISEVAYSSNKEETVEVCVDLSFPGLKGENRCFFLQTVDVVRNYITSPCKDIVCYNGGRCIADVKSFTAMCLCRAGWKGAHCADESTSDISFMNLFFTDTAKPSILRCVVDQQCSVEFVLSGYPRDVLLVEPLPRIMLGRVDAEVDVVTTKVEPLPQAHMYSLDVTLEGKHIGLYDACIQARYNYRVTWLKLAEVCFKVDVTQDVSILYGHMNRPHFVAPSLPTQSEVICTEGTICHVLYNVTAGDGNSGKCVTAYPTSYSDALKFHIFSTCGSCSSTSGSSTEYCQIDVSFESSDAGNKHHLCVGLRINNSDLIGEERCFNVYIPSTEEAYNSSASSCYNLQCQYGGFCDGTVPRCYCKMGYTGKNCFERLQDSYTNAAKRFVPRDIGFPRTITCGIDTVCTVPFVVSSNDDAQSNCSIGFSSSQLRASIAECNIHDTFPRLILQVHPNKMGKYSTCVQLIKQDIKSDEVCVTVDVIDSSRNGIDKTKPFFVSPTLPDHTTVLCQKDPFDLCHVLLYFNAGASNTGQCPTIRQVEVPSVKTLHIFEPELYGNHCISDVAYSSNKEETVEVCVDLSFPGLKGENRCFFLQTVDVVRDHLGLAIVGPDIEHLTVHEGSTLSMECNVTGSSAPLHYLWLKTNRCNVSYPSGPVLTVSSSSSAGNSGEYTCTAYDGMSKNVTKTFIVTVTGNLQTISSCDFDADNICNWKQLTSDQNNWIIFKEPTQTSGTGPDADHSQGNGQGYYIYIEASSPVKEGSVSLISSEMLPANTTVCFQFWYHMYGDAIGELSVFIMDDCTNSINRTIFSLNGNQGNQWRKAEVTIPSSSVPNDYMLVVNGTVGNGFRGDIAVDDFLISRGECHTTFGPGTLIG